jgi:halogenation protein CepH
MQGHRVLVLEKEKFPRYQIGESLLPATVRGICRLTGAMDAVSQAGFTLKRGGTFRWGSNPEPWTFSFSVSPKMAGATSYAYQVERSRFDQILLDNARRVGAQVREECTVTRIIADAERVRGVSYLDTAGNEVEVHARYVVDASGNRSSLYREAGGERNYSDFFRSLALFGYFDGGKRLPEPNSGNILCAAFDSGWFWYIPLSDRLTSVGAVVRRDLAEKVQGDPEAALRSLIAECPLISDYLDGAERITEGQYGRIRVRKDYSYHCTKFWRPGLALIGDAACFVDPIFSSGVHLATYSALLAARSINSVLARLVDEESAFAEFERRYRREYGIFYEFLASFYDMHENEESYFWSAKKITNGTASDLESFVDLVGGVASGDQGPLGVDRFEQRAREVATAVDEFVADEQRTMLPWFNSALVREVTEEMTNLQSLAMLGDTAGVAQSEHGLVPSPDGMFWIARDRLSTSR